MAPFDLSSIVGTLPYYLIFLAIGIGFGSVLEMAGFGDSRKLAAQFYLKDMTVLKVMFTAIIVAAVLIQGASALGLLSFERLWVNPTYLMPGIIGGLIMGIGFIIGGFCPGTSIVAASTLKLDGVAFVVGVGLGVWTFSESASALGDMRHATFMGRFTLDELFGIPIGIVLVLLISMALMMFFAGELAETVFGKKQQLKKETVIPKNKYKIIGSAALLSCAIIVAIIGQPDAHEKWKQLEPTAGVALSNRAPYIHPAEVVEWRGDPTVNVRVLDVRKERDFNQFHILGSLHVDLVQLEDPQFIKAFGSARDNTLTFVVSNDESAATAAWKILMAQNVSNTYIIEGGINNWLAIYPPDPCIAIPITGRNVGDEILKYEFKKSVGDNCYSAHPEAPFKEAMVDCQEKVNPAKDSHSFIETDVRPIPFDIKGKHKFERKVKFEKKSAVTGGCG